MKIRSVAHPVATALLVLATACSGHALGAEAALPLDTDQIARLGIRFALPEPSAELTVATAPAEVVVPPASQAVVSTPVSGLVSALYVAEGDSVEAGQPVAEILSAEYMDLQRQYLEAAAAADLAATQLARDEELHEDGIIADRRLQETQAAARSAALRVSQVRQQLRIAGYSDSTLAQLEAQLELASGLVLRASEDGVIAAQYVRVGESLAALDPVVRVVDVTELWLEARLPQEVAVRVTPDMRIRIGQDADAISGPITTIGRVVDQETQTVLVRSVIDNDNGDLLAGQFLTIEITADSRGVPILTVPGGALTRERNETYVFVRTESGVAPRRVELLAEGRDRAYIESGLEADALVATSGVSALKAMWLTADE